MGIKTDISWCDSTLNLMMGCDGCELWNRKAGVTFCYAGTLTDRYRGFRGWPLRFEEPKLFTERLEPALKWRDLTGTDRPDKPWLNRLPRMVFLDDMGDTFTESLPADWLAPLLPRIATSPHVFLLLTKRATRMRDFSQQYPLPPNVWPGVSVTTQRSTARVAALVKVQGGGPKWVSAEPLWEAVDLEPWLPSPQSNGTLAGYGHEMDASTPRVRWVIIGGQSGQGARPFDIRWAEALLAQCRRAHVPPFLKQLGAAPRDADGKPLALEDAKGENMEEFPPHLRVREVPRSGSETGRQV